MFDPEVHHRFVTCGDMQFSEKDGWYFFANLCAQFDKPSEQYHTVVKFASLNETNALEMRQKMASCHLFLANQTKKKLYPLLEEDGREKDGVLFEVYTSLSSTSPITTTSLKVLDVVQMKHFEPADDPDVAYPDTQTYFMFGNGQKVFLSHCITRKPDFQQVRMN